MTILAHAMITKSKSLQKLELAVRDGCRAIEPFLDADGRVISA